MNQEGGDILSIEEGVAVKAVGMLDHFLAQDLLRLFVEVNEPALIHLLMEASIRSGSLGQLLL